MKSSPLKKALDDARHLLILSTALLTGACHASDQFKNEVNQVSESPKDESVQTEVIQTADCPIISSQNWSAQIEIDDEGKPMLSIKGDIELPNPGYSVVLQEGIANLSLPPIQHFNLKTERLSGFYIQAVTSMTLEHSSPAGAERYRSVIIHCGEQTIATIDNVTAKQ